MVTILQIEIKHNSLTIKRYAQKIVYVGNAMFKASQFERFTFQTYITDGVKYFSVTFTLWFHMF